jgi:H+/Cl- antiporter ClcA
VLFAGTGLLIGIITVQYAPEAEGPGLHIVIAAFNKRHGTLRLRTGIAKYVTTFLTMGAGTANGIVSPSALLGNAVASWFQSTHDADQQKTLALCGVSAALSTLLGTPFGAALFAAEVVYGNYILYKRFFYCLASSVTAYTVTSFLQINPVYTVVPLVALTPEMVFFIIVTALVVVFVNIGYIVVYQKIHDFFFDRSWKRPWLIPGLGMGLAAVVMIPVYDELAQVPIVGGHAIPVVEVHQLALVFVVICATSLVAGTGGSGGLFTPVMVVGVLLSASIGSQTSFPHLLVPAGISAALCTTLNVPLASALLCVELFGPAAVVPSIIGSLTGYLLAKRYVIYHEIQWEELKE